MLDANLLCLLVVGLTDPTAISQHRRLRTFVRNDFAIVQNIVELFDMIVVCPHVLTEASNLLGFEDRGGMVRRSRRTLAAIVADFEERSYAAPIAMDDVDYLRLGLTDAVLLLLANQSTVLLTADLHLALAADARGHYIINYNHVRDGAITLEQIARMRLG